MSRLRVWWRQLRISWAIGGFEIPDRLPYDGDDTALRIWAGRGRKERKP